MCHVDVHYVAHFILRRGDLDDMRHEATSLHLVDQLLQYCSTGITVSNYNIEIVRLGLAASVTAADRMLAAGNHSVEDLHDLYISSVSS